MRSCERSGGRGSPVEGRVDRETDGWTDKQTVKERKGEEEYTHYIISHHPSRLTRRGVLSMDQTVVDVGENAPL